MTKESLIAPMDPILLVEDNEEDYQTTLRAFKRSHLANEVYRCEDGEDALDYVFQRGRYSDKSKAPRPGIILLDLNLPGTDGRQVLKELKADRRLKTVPVIVLTTSDDERDIQACYDAGANSYVQKPVNLERFMEAIQRLNDYWFKIALLPRKAEAA